jgi:hypothetical protein
VAYLHRICEKFQLRIKPEQSKESPSKDN